VSFVTRVGEKGEWSGPPDHWSFSTLTEAESCPLQYALRHATYTGPNFSGPGYPDKVSEAALIGTVIHGAVEQVLKALRYVDVSDPVAATAALRGLGGYSKIVGRCIDVVLERLSSNHRVKARVPRLAAGLHRRTPEIRSAVQGLVARLPPAAASNEPVPQPMLGNASVPSHGPLAPGRYPEAHLRADDERFKGQIDLLTVGHDAADIVDFKSGARDEHHQEQLLLYGLLWLLDHAANPGGLLVGQMTLAYPGEDASVPHPKTWSDVEADLRRRIGAADDAIAGAPVARLSSACAWCSVRHMCEPYWSSDHATIDPGAFGDIEVEVIARNGPMSWTARLTRTTERALLRTTDEDLLLTAASTVRLLDVACERQTADDGDAEVVVLTAVASSEMFEVRSP